MQTDGGPLAHQFSDWSLKGLRGTELTSNHVVKIRQVKTRQGAVGGMGIADRRDASGVELAIQFALVNAESGSKSHQCRAKNSSRQNNGDQTESMVQHPAKNAMGPFTWQSL